MAEEQVFDFDAQIQDEDGSIYPVPGTEIGMDIEEDFGSGSYAEDGPTEVGSKSMLVRMLQRRTGDPNRRVRVEPEPEPVQTRPIAMMGAYAAHGATEIGNELDPYGSVMANEYTLDAGPASLGPSEIGAYASQGASEIGERRLGGPYAKSGPTEIGEEECILRCVEQARDNRQPPPPMRAVDIDVPPQSWEGMHAYVGAACIVGGGAKDPFPLTTKLMLRAAASGEPRMVRIDTAESYKRFRAAESPEMAEFAARVEELNAKLDDHMSDPNAHDAIVEEIDDVVALGAAVDEALAAKRVELWMPQRFTGLIEAWREGDFVCVSMALPGADGEVRICTSLEPIRKCIAEMAQHAKEARVPASAVLGVLPAMGCVLGAGTVIKEVAKAAPDILKHPNATQSAPFVLRIEPKVAPAVAAMAQLVFLCKQGNAQACDEWQRLGAAAPAPVRQAMKEALALVKAA